MKQQPLFITFEGCESSGKTTHSRLLFNWLQQNQINALLTREPGGTSTAEQIRTILLDNNTQLNVKSQLLLHFASRIEHVENVIKPALANNKIVICDRFFDSTIAYQHYGHGLDLSFIKKMHKELLDNITPNLTFILNVNFVQYKKRMAKKHTKNDRYETLSDDYHKKVISGFKKIAAKNPDRCISIDSSDSQTDTHNLIASEFAKIAL
jgi:dTMP kinase